MGQQFGLGSPGFALMTAVVSCLTGFRWSRWPRGSWCWLLTACAGSLPRGLSSSTWLEGASLHGGLRAAS